MYPWLVIDLVEISMKKITNVPKIKKAENVPTIFLKKT